MDGFHDTTHFLQLAEASSEVSHTVPALLPCEFQTENHQTGSEE